MKSCVIVTGGSRGIGNKIVKKLLKEKISVIYTYQHNSLSHHELETLAFNHQVTCLKYQLDQSKSDEVIKFYNWVLTQCDYIDGFINNAGISKSNLVINISDEEWQKVIDVNLTGPFYMVRAFARKLMEQREGFIINIASTTGMDGGIGISNYAASKGGLIAFSKSIGFELARFGIRNYIIAPGYIDTEMLMEIEDAKMKHVKESIQLGRLGMPEEIAELVSFLIKGKNYIQNTVIRADGGLVNK